MNIVHGMLIMSSDVSLICEIILKDMVVYATIDYIIKF